MRPPERSHGALAVLAVLALSAGAAPAAAGARAPMNQVIDELEVATAAGAKAKIAGPADASVIVFFRPDQPQHAATLRALAACEKALAGKSIQWIAIVPERFSAAEAKAAADAAGLQMPIGLDAGEQVYERIGVSVHPTVVVLDKAHRLAQFQPYTKLNFCDLVEARILRVLGDLDDAGLQRRLDPSADAPKAGPSASRRDLKLAEMLLKSGNTAQALEVAQKAAASDPQSAAAQGLVGHALALRGSCAAAAAPIAAALKLDPADAHALAGRAACDGKR